MNTRMQRIFRALTMCILFTSSAVLAQDPQVNLLPNNISNFNIGNIGNGYPNNVLPIDVTTDYFYVNSENGLLAPSAVQHYAIGNDAYFYNHQINWAGIEQGFFHMWDHTSGNGNGNYMIVNGATSSDKIVWEYTVPVSPGVMYDFKAWATCLFIRIMGQPGDNARPRLRLKINGNNVPGSDPFTVPWANGGQWTQWTQSWTAGNNTFSATITIIDECTEANGNDFGLDDIVFKMKDGYSLTANDFTVSYCGEITPIELQRPAHYDWTYPSGGNAAPPMQVMIRKNDNESWATSITTNHGSANVGSDNKIYYTPDAGFYGTDNLQYKISRFGLESSSTITINVGDVPSNCIPQGLPANNLLCISDVSSFNPSASWTGSNIISGWLYKKVGVTDWQESYNFQSWVAQWGGVGEYSIKFFAQNSCTSPNYVYSEPYDFNICDVPQWITQPTVTSICTGSAEPTVSINWNYNTGVQTWQYKRDNGNWIDFGCSWDDFDLLPGDQVRYRVTYNACSGNPLTSQTINVVPGPQFNTSIPVSFDEGYCPGSQVTLPPIQTSWYNDYGMSVTSGWYYVNYDPSGSPSYVPITGSTITLNNGSVSLTPCLQNTECGFTPYYPAFNLVVWDAPAIQGLEELPDSLGPVCSGTALSSILPELSPGGHYLDNGYGWEISSGQSQTGFSSNLPSQLSVEHNGRWLRYRVQKDCTAHSDTISDPIRLWVGDEPTLNTESIEPFDTVCAGTLVASLVEVYVTNWNLFHDEDSFERWEVYYGGSWTEFTQFELDYNGCQVRYHAQNQCGEVIVSAGVVNVTEGPSFNNPEMQLGFEEYYCDGNTLELPTPPGYDGHGVDVHPDWVYFDGEEYHTLNPSEPPTLNESWDGRQITYVLESDCGGEIYYPTPFTLIVKGHPEVEITLDGSDTFCVGTTIALDTVIDWHLCTENTQESSWQYAPSDQPSNYSDFDPIVGIPEAGMFLVTYHAVANECEFDAYGNPLSVTVEAVPAFENEVPFELSRFCEDEVLQLPSDPVVIGHVDDAGWQISVGTDQFGEYTDEIVSVLSLEDDGRWLRYYVLGCNVPIHYDVEIHVDGKPWEEYSIVDRICKGQLLSYQLLDANGYPVTDRDWRMGSPTGEPFNPDEDTFDEEGEYSIYYRVGNDCGWSDYTGPMHLTVTAGPEFNNSSLPNPNEPQYVCEGITVGEFLQQLGIAEPELLNPTVPHNPLGWFINGQSVELDDLILEGFHGTGLCYGVSGDCSDVPVYSSSILLYVYGHPEVTQMPSMAWEFCDGDVVQLPNPEIAYHQGEDQVNGYWQIQYPDGTWGDLPTNWSADGLQVRYHLEHTVCPDFANDSWEIPITVYVAPDINDDDLPTSNSLMFCSGGSLGIGNPYVDWHQFSPGESGWQVSANEQDWSTELEGHVFDPSNLDDFFDGKYLRYHAESMQCPNLEDNSIVYSIQLKDDIEKPLDMEVCESFELPDGQTVSGDGQYSYIISSPDGCDTIVNLTVTFTQTKIEQEDYSACNEYEFNDSIYYAGYHQIYYDTLYYANGCDSIVHCLNLTVTETEQMGTISGNTSVYVASSLISGVYRYEIDMEGLSGQVTWSLSNSDWQIVETGIDFCRVLVTTPVTAFLTAHFNVEDCGEMERSFEINATFYGVDDWQDEVRVFPNPTRGTVTIEAEGMESIRLTNMMGQVLEKREGLRSDSIILNLNGYTPSVYLLEIETAYGMVKKRLVLCR